ncbi:centromere protein N isoform X2 [Anolis carolinensis]|uniref:Centromere protein N n=1 Tax=Anolis carolinensis TaxID=28377 RepID=H9GEG8_ANOCA|nr:PREDICTED: centromere protein N isoform X2 [Anolis carolinensis]|eukprot:XP_003222999.1 PREDICTED: centromere protein N isoform X2 [Anolis carolinensis]
MAKKRPRESPRQNPPVKVFIMDVTVAEYIRRTVLRIPRSETRTMLTRWKFLSDSQLQSLNTNQKKEDISREVVELCQENCATITHAADLDMIYSYTYRDKMLWDVYQMIREEGDENDFFDLANFTKKFEESLRSSFKNVTITFKEFEDNSIWIRVAWGAQYRKPNQYKPSYVVYHSQTPYVFICKSINKSSMPLLFQALLVAANYSDIHEMDLRSRCLDSLKDIVFKRCSKSFPTHHLQPLQEKNSNLENVDPRIIREDKHEKERIQRIDRETFGDGPQPKLEFAQYRLKTTFRGDLINDILPNIEPFRCTVKFSSPHLLEALRSLAPAGIADAPLSPLLTCITQKARNHFNIREREGAHSKNSPGQGRIYK